MSKSAKDYNSEGLKLLKNSRYEAAVDFFTLAIDEDPGFFEAYKNRGEALIKLDRVAEGEKDIEIAEKAKKNISGKVERKRAKQKKAVQKFNLQEAEDLYGSLLSDENTDFDEEGEMFGLDDFLYDDASPDDVLADDQAYVGYDDQFVEDNLLHDDNYSEDSAATDQFFGTQKEYIPADTILSDEGAVSEDEGGQEEYDGETPQAVAETVLSGSIEYIGGMRQEFSKARLFEPLENSLLIIDEETADEQVIFFEQLTCLQVSGLPDEMSGFQKESCTREVIETVDGKTYREFVLPGQTLDHLLICRPADNQEPFAFTIFPLSNIKKRTLDVPLTDILLKKRFISRVMLKKARQEYEQMKSLTLEKIIAQRARIPLAEIEEAFNQARQTGMGGLQKEEILLISGLVSEEAILDAAEYLEHLKELKIEDYLVERGMVKEREIYLSLAEKHKIPFVDLKGRKFSRKSLASLPRSMIMKHEILPLAIKDGTLLVASHCPDMTHLIESIVQTAGCKDVLFVLAPPADIRAIIKLIYAKMKK